jgi:hypothetical protein
MSIAPKSVAVSEPTCCGGDAKGAAGEDACVLGSVAADSAASGEVRGTSESGEVAEWAEQPRGRRSPK